MRDIAKASADGIENLIEITRPTLGEIIEHLGQPQNEINSLG
jgi:hypothetical protein